MPHPNQIAQESLEVEWQRQLAGVIETFPLAALVLLSKLGAVKPRIFGPDAKPLVAAIAKINVAAAVESSTISTAGVASGLRLKDCFHKMELAIARARIDSELLAAGQVLGDCLRSQTPPPKP